MCLISGCPAPQGAPQHVCTQGGLEEPGELLPRVSAEGLCTLSSSHTQALWLERGASAVSGKNWVGFWNKATCYRALTRKLSRRLSPDNPLSRAGSLTGAISGSIFSFSSPSHSGEQHASSCTPPPLFPATGPPGSHQIHPAHMTNPPGSHQIHPVHTKSTWLTRQIHPAHTKSTWFTPNPPGSHCKSTWLTLQIHLVHTKSTRLTRQIHPAHTKSTRLTTNPPGSHDKSTRFTRQIHLAHTANPPGSHYKSTWFT